MISVYIGNDILYFGNCTELTYNYAILYLSMCYVSLQFVPFISE